MQVMHQGKGYRFHHFDLWLWISLSVVLAMTPLAVHAGGTDCNNNGIDDAIDIANGTSRDCNGDGVLDECESNVAFRPIKSTLSFGPQQYYGALALDVDADGDLDFVTVQPRFSNSNFLQITRNLNGNGPSLFDSSVFLLPIAANGGTSLESGDFDGDGDMDIVVAPNADGGVSWLENEDGMGNEWVAHSITNTVSGDVQIFVRDFDNDNDPDLIFGSTGQAAIGIWLNTDGLGSFSELTSITPGTAFSEISVCDIDGDTDFDIVTVGSFPNPCRWYRYDHVAQSFGPAISIPTPFTIVNQIDTGDIDGDGDQDLFIGRRNSTDNGWMRNADGMGTFVLGQNLTQPGTGVTDLKLTDVDGDHDLDVIVLSPVTSRNLEWRINQDGSGMFSTPYERQQVFPILYDEMKLADVDGNGRQDAILTPASPNDPIVIAYATNRDCDNNGMADACELADGLLEDCNGNGFPDSCDAVIDDCNANDVPDSCEGDCDFNGLIDACDPKISFNYTIAGTSAGRFSGLDAGDIDGDGDIDAITTDRTLGSVQWHANDGGGGFGPAILVADQLPAAYEVILLDIDQDAAVDVVFGTVENGTLGWCRNTDGLGSFGPIQVIDSTYDEYTRIRFADIDGDGDQDLVVTAYDGAVLWYEKLDAMPGFAAGRVVSSTLIDPFALDLADVDGDGDVDIIAAAFGDTKVVWFENSDGLGNFGNARTIYDQQTGTILVRSFDWEGDGDLDVIVEAQGVAPSPQIGHCYVMENEDGLGGQWGRRLAPVSRNVLASGSAIVDIDGDGLVDIVRTEGRHLTVGTRFGREGNPWNIIQLDNLDLGPIDAIEPADLDGDGNIDLLVTAPIDGLLYAAIKIPGDCNSDGIPDHCQTDSDFDGIINDCEPQLGDMNCNGVVTLADVPAFSLALTDANGYAAAYPGCDIELADMSADNVIDGRDIDGFIAALVAP